MTNASTCPSSPAPNVTLRSRRSSESERDRARRSISSNAASKRPDACWDFSGGHSDISSAKCVEHHGHRANKKAGEWPFVEDGRTLHTIDRHRERRSSRRRDANRALRILTRCVAATPTKVQLGCHVPGAASGDITPQLGPRYVGGSKPRCRAPAVPRP